MQKRDSSASGGAEPKSTSQGKGIPYEENFKEIIRRE